MCIESIIAQRRASYDVVYKQPRVPRDNYKHLNGYGRFYHSRNTSDYNERAAVHCFVQPLIIIIIIFNSTSLAGRQLHILESVEIIFRLSTTKLSRKPMIFVYVVCKHTKFIHQTIGKHTGCLRRVVLGQGRTLSADISMHKLPLFPNFPHSYGDRPQLNETRTRRDGKSIPNLDVGTDLAEHRIEINSLFRGTN